MKCLKDELPSSINQYDILEVAGQGTFGTVYKCTVKSSKDRYYAIKIVILFLFCRSGKIRYKIMKWLFG